MDLSLIAIDYEKLELEFAGAYNPLYIVRDNAFIILPADKFAIGSFDPGSKNYSNQVFQLQKGDQIYLFTDGYADQFGGVKGKKFLYKTFREELLRVHSMGPEEQREALNKTITDWQGDYAQVDDILHLIWMGMVQTGIGTILCRLIRLNFLKMASTSPCLASTDASSHLPASKAMAHSSSS